MAAEPLHSVLITTDAVGGVWHYAVELAGALSRTGVRVALAAMGPPPAPCHHRFLETLPAVTLHERPCKLEWMHDPWDDVHRAGEWLLELERELSPDIVHLNQFAFGALPFSAPTLLAAHSCVLSWWRAVHGSAAPENWNAYRKAVRRGLSGADCLVAPTRTMANSLAENYGVRTRVLAIPNGRDALRYAPGRKEAFILAAGRLWDEAKNLAALEGVAPRLAWPVMVAGAQAQPGGVVRQPRGVQILGDLPPDALAAEYARASIYALPARYEPFGLSILEAALSGCALVLGDIPSLRETWGPAAVYVPPDDHEALCHCITRLIEEPHRRAHLAHSARLRALGYTPQRMADAYLNAYRRACQRRRRAVRAVAQNQTAGVRACAW
jgi:glycosyltransferase involved in cell wall biosynthesis